MSALEQTLRQSFVWVAATLVAAVAFAQTPATPSEKNMFVATPDGWTAPRTPWGDPDLRGTWPISYVGSVPLERCAGDDFARGSAPKAPCDPHKAFLTDEEFKARVAAAARRGDRYAEAVKEGDLGKAFQTGITDPTTPQRQTSLIVDPPDGRLPAMTAAGKRLSSKMRSSWALPGETPTFDSERDFDTWDRCITRGMPASMFPYRYNNGLQILQTPGYVVLNMEMIHEARIVPLDGDSRRPPISPKITEWLGESRGRWDGTTLVIVTTNFKAGASATNIGVMGSPPGNRFPTSERMRITERITRMNDDTLLYEITTEDPVVLTRPWTARFPLKLDNGYVWWEYACHEGNRTIPDYISASRAERAHAAKEPVKVP
ncbi:MAG TPA: hypothetical protein VG871_15555 [Vicinamibacterales bacterium]|nr:hypothetical protein [Vicinamibacterales bacterium]